MRALWSDRQNCSHNVSHKVKRIRRLSEKGPEEHGAAGYFPKILLLKRATMVLCPFHRSHREICTRNRPISETKFLDDFWCQVATLALYSMYCPEIESLLPLDTVNLFSEPSSPRKSYLVDNVNSPDAQTKPLTVGIWYCKGCT